MNETNEQSNEIIRTEDLCYVYSAGMPFQKTALKNINFHADSGEIVALIGHTGSGKSTLVQHLNGLLRPTSGKVFVNGIDIWGGGVNMRDVRFTVGIVFQYPEYQLFAETVMEDIAYGPRNMGLTEDEVFKSVRDAAEIVGIVPKTLCRSPFELSGGQKRRVAIAGVLAMQPRVIVMDEPCAGLDAAGSRDILRCINDYRNSTGSTVIFVTHSMEDAARIANRIVVVNDGEIAMEGSRNDIFSQTEKLDEMGLAIPEVSEVCRRLRFNNVPISENIYTVKSAKEQILALYRKNQRKQCRLE